MHRRREVLGHSLRLAGLLAGAGLLPGLAHGAWPAAAFEARSLADAMKALGASMPAASKEVVLTAPDIAENGAVVPLAVSTTLTGVRRLMLLVEKNPNVLSAVFEVTDAVEADLGTRVKMGQTSQVYAVAQLADGRLIYAQKEVKVTLGGCGG